MTSVIPGWKLALIERKRKKDKEEKTKLQENNERLNSLPEWKRSIISKRKGFQSYGGDTSVGKSSIGNDLSVDGHAKLGQNINYSPTFRDAVITSPSGVGNGDHSESLPVKTSHDFQVIHKETLVNGTPAEQHSFVTSGLSENSGQQREDQQFNAKLSTNSREEHSSSEPRFERGRYNHDGTSSVSYEHITTPSELRKLYGVVTSRTPSTNSVDSSKAQSSQTLSNQDLVPRYRASSPSDQHHSQVPVDPKENEIVILKTNEIVSSESSGVLQHKSLQTSAVNEINKENNITIPSLKDDSVGHEKNRQEDMLPGVHGNDDSSPVIHVNAIRDKFGPSGKFRQRSSSTDNILKSSPQQSPPNSSRGTPPPFNKRWSMLSLSKSSEDEYFSEKSDQSGLKRGRSISMHDVRSEHHFHPEPSPVNLSHRASISSGIEHRLHVLLHHLSTDKLDSDDDDDDDDDKGDDAAFESAVMKDLTYSNKRGTSHNQMETEPTRLRKASWFEPETNTTLQNGLEVSMDSKTPLHPTDTTERTHSRPSLPAKRPKKAPSDESIMGKNASHEIMVKGKEKPARTLGSGKEVVGSEEKRSNDNEISKAYQPDVHKMALSTNGEVRGSLKPAFDDSQNEDKPTRGSVHKLSALFGSSISKGLSKKAKKDEVTNDHMPRKTVQDKQSKQDNSPRTYPWSKQKNENKDLTVKKPEEEQPVQFKGRNSLRHVQQDVIEQKITGNLTLVTTADRYNSKFRPYQVSSPPVASQQKSSNVQGMGKVNNSSMNALPSTSIKNQRVLSAPFKNAAVVTDTPNDIQISAIDMPEPSSSTPVSVIDVPEFPVDDIKVSIIDTPEDEEDSDDSDSSDDAMSGSYDVNPIEEPQILSFGVRSSESNDYFDEEEEEDEDIDNVPVSYVGDSTYMVVPEVIFNTERENVKTCLSGPLYTRKRKNKVVFKTEKLVKVHDYPSERCLQSHYDQHLKENGSLDNYRPSYLQDYDATEKLQHQEATQNPKAPNTLDNSSKEVTRITYLDEGEGFSSSSSSTGALLF